MLRSEIQVALEAAAKISLHREFVIAGSLSVLGYKEIPPEMMSLSIDIDFFPLGDQTDGINICRTAKGNANQPVSSVVYNRVGVTKSRNYYVTLSFK